MRAPSKEKILELKKQLEKAEIKKTIENLLTFDTNEDKALIRLLSSRWSSLERENLMGIIDIDNFRLEKNKITFALFNILDNLEQQQVVSAKHQTNSGITTQEKTIVFKIKKQQIYLLKSLQGLECYKEDLNPKETGHQWTISKQDAKEILEKEQISVNPNYTARSGMYSLGARKNWLYSKKLYPDPEYFKTLLTELLKEVSA